MVEPIAADEVTRRQRDEPGIFVHLTDHINRADDAQTARIDQPHLDAFGGKRHPRINIRRIIVVINQNVIAFAKI